MEKEIRDNIVDNINYLISVNSRIIDNKSGFKHRPKHRHNSIQITIVNSGTIECIINSIPTIIYTHSILMLGSKLSHGLIKISDKIHITIIHISFSILQLISNITEFENCLKFITNSKYGYLFNDETIYKKVMVMTKKLNNDVGLRKISDVFELLHILQCNNKTQIIYNAKVYEDILIHSPISPVEKAYNYICDNYKKNITLNDISQFANQNSTSLCRSFKKNIGYSMFQLLNKLRIEKSCQLLDNSNMTIQQIAYEVGYNTFSNFSSQFMKQIKQTPSEYRHRVKELQ